MSYNLQIKRRLFAGLVSKYFVHCSLYGLSLVCIYDRFSCFVSNVVESTIALF